MLIFLFIGISSIAIQMRIGAWSTFAGLGDNWNSNFNQLFTYTFNYIWYGFIGALIWMTGKQQKNIIGKVIVIIILVIPILLILFVLGSKTYFLSVFVWTIVVLIASRRKIPIWMIVTTAAFISILAFSFIPTYRSLYIQRYGRGTGNFENFISVGVDSISKINSSKEELQKSIGELISRFGGIDNAAAVIMKVPDKVGYRYFKDFLYIPFSFVPRIIFPWKPSTNLGIIYNIYITGSYYGGSAAPHPIGEGYFNFGFIGVIILFWIWGVYQSILYNGFFLNNSNNPIVIIIFSFFILDAINFGGWIFGSIAKLPQQIIVLLPFYFIIRMKFKK